MNPLLNVPKQFTLALAFLLVSGWSNASGEPKPLSQASNRIVVIGDIHGDLRALLKILIELKLIDSKTGAWIGGSAQLELAGDLVAKGNSSRGVLDFVMAVQKNAEAQGGGVHSVMGNHELMSLQQMFGHYVPLDQRAFESFENGEGVRGMSGAFSGSSRYLKWVSGLPLAREFQLHDHSGKLVRYVLVHAGLPRIGSRESLLELKAGNLSLQDSRLNMVWDGEIASGTIEVEDFEKLKTDYGFDCLIVGHNITSDTNYQIARAFSNSLIRIDTGNSQALRGRPSALELIDGRAPRDHYFDRAYSNDVLALEAMILAERERPFSFDSVSPPCRQTVQKGSRISN